MPTSNRFLNQVFNSALRSLGGQDEGQSDKSDSSPFLVEGGAMFNAAVRLCLARMAPAIYATLDVSEAQATRSGQEEDLEISVYLFF